MESFLLLIFVYFRAERYGKLLASLVSTVVFEATASDAIAFSGDVLFEGVPRTNFLSVTVYSAQSAVGF